MSNSNDEFASELDGVDVHDGNLAEDWDELEPAPAVVSVPSSSGTGRSSTPDSPGAAAAATAVTASTLHATASMTARPPAAGVIPRPPVLAAPVPATAAPVPRPAAPLVRPAAGSGGHPIAARPPAPASAAVRPGAGAAARSGGVRPPVAGGTAALALHPAAAALRPPAAGPSEPRPAAAVAAPSRPRSAGAAPAAVATTVSRPAGAAQPRPPLSAAAAAPRPAAQPRLLAAAAPAAAQLRPAMPSSAVPSGVLPSAAIGVARPAAAVAAAPRAPSAGQLPVNRPAAAGAAVALPAPRSAVPSAAPKVDLSSEIQPVSSSASLAADKAGNEDACSSGTVSTSDTGGAPAIVWGGGWAALGRLGASLQAAASIAIKDVSDLGESFQKVLHEVAEASDDEDEAGAQAVRAAPPPGAEAPLPPDQEAKRRQVLARLAAEDEAAVSPPLQPRAAGQEGEAGSSQGTAAAEAGGTVAPVVATKALSGLWGWGKGLASRVEQAATSVGRELAETVHDAQPAVQTVKSHAVASGRAAEFRIGSTLGALGRHAQGLLESALEGPSRGSAAGGQQDEEPVSFADQLYIYGGRSAQEDLEALSNDSARTANCLRTLLGEEERGGLDVALATLAPIFDLKAPHPADSAAAGSADVAAIAAGHAVIEELAAAGCKRADLLAQAAADSLAQLVMLAAPSETGTDAATRAAAADAPGNDATAAEGAADAPSGSGSTEPASQGKSRRADTVAAGRAAAAPPPALKALTGLHADGVRSVAELCSLCLERLLALGRSLSFFYRYGRPANDGIAWPAGPEHVALLLRRQALHMLDDVAGVGAAFGAALASAGSHLDALASVQASSKLYSHAAAPLARGLQADSEAAAGHIQDACRALLQVVWLTSVPRETVEDLL